MVTGSFVFLRKSIRFSPDGRRAFTVPKEVARFLHPDQVYEVSLAPVGTIVVRRDMKVGTIHG